MNLLRSSRRWMLIPFFVLVFFAGARIALLVTHHFNQDRQFEEYTQELFCREITSSTLNLHYTLAHPEDYGIDLPKISLGEITTNTEETSAALENYEAGIRQFSYDQLSEENQITYDTLLLYFHTLRESAQYPLLEEVLSPGLGIQAQLPVLLAEYPFYDEEDIQDYLALLTQTTDYFQSILDFEVEKSQAGYFMNDTSLKGILSQCREFTQNPDENYLLDIFQDKITNLDYLTSEEKDAYTAANKKLIKNHVIPAYQLLMKGLDKLKGTGKNEKGLCFYPQGKEYYTSLLRAMVGVYDSPDSIRQQVYTQLVKDYSELAALLQENPALISQIASNTFQMEDPNTALKELKEASNANFPALDTPDYQLKYVHKSMEDHLSPAFYLTPPIDTGEPNIIYINQASQSSDLELYTTLGHEGFPGHLYQTQYFSHTNPAAIRYLPNFGGYVEGWATYVESYTYTYVPVDKKLSRALWLNRSINLGLCSIIDLGVHYYGWSRENVLHYLTNFGITSQQAADSIYQAILEDPANYLKYYLGCLNFQDLKQELQAIQGDEFDLKSFHQEVLTIGPTQFPVLRRHLGLSLS